MRVVLEVRDSTPGADELDSGFHPFGVDTMSTQWVTVVKRLRMVSSTEGRKMVCVALQEITVTCNVRGDNW